MFLKSLKPLHLSQVKHNLVQFLYDLYDFYLSAPDTLKTFDRSIIEPVKCFLSYTKYCLINFQKNYNIFSPTFSWCQLSF